MGHLFMNCHGEMTFLTQGILASTPVFAMFLTFLRQVRNLFTTSTEVSHELPEA